MLVKDTLIGLGDTPNYASRLLQQYTISYILW